MTDSAFVLFIGCGDGSEMEALATEPGVRIVGLEPAKVFYERAARRFNERDHVTVRQQGLHEFSLAAKSIRFDLIYMLFPAPQMLLFHHRQVAAAIKRLLRPADGAFVLCSEITSDWLNLQAQFACARLRDALTESGFTIEASVAPFAALPMPAKMGQFIQDVREDESIRYEVVCAKLITRQ